MGVDAGALNAIKTAGRTDTYAAAFLAANFKSYVVRLRSKAETYQDESRVRHNVLSIRPVRVARHAGRAAWPRLTGGRAAHAKPRTPPRRRVADRVCARVQGHPARHPQLWPLRTSGARCVGQARD